MKTNTHWKKAHIDLIGKPAEHLPHIIEYRATAVSQGFTLREFFILVDNGSADDFGTPPSLDDFNPLTVYNRAK